MSAVTGWVGAVVASLFFGSNYVPTKNYPQGDGMSFVWIFSSGVLTVGIISMFITGKSIFIYTGLIGGSCWAAGNLCVVPIIKLVGLGLGILVWGSSSLITGFLLGKTGLFDLKKDEVAQPAINWVGFALVVIAMATFFFIKPDLKEKARKESSPLLPKEGADLYSIQVKEDRDENHSIFDEIPAKSKALVGTFLAVISGILYGINMVPMSIWVQHQKNEGKHPGALDFVFSHFVGIYLFSTTAYLLYCIFHRPPQIFPQSILPSYISGVMWGVAQCGLMTTTQILGYTIGFPIGSAGPLVISSLWSVVYFGEIRGRRNLTILLGSLTLLGTGIALLALSHSK